MTTDPTTSPSPWGVATEQMLAMRVQRLNQLASEGHWDDVVIEAEELLSRHPAHRTANILLGRALTRVGDWVNAATTLQALIGAHTPLDVRYDFAATCLELGHLDDARLQMERVLAESADDPACHFVYGLVLERQAHPFAAQSLMTAHQLDPETYPVPVPLTDDDLLALFEEARLGLAGPMFAFWTEVDVVVDSLPAYEQLAARLHLDSVTALGWTETDKPPDVTDAWAERPDRLRLFRTNLERTGSVDAARTALADLLAQEALDWLNL